MLRKWGRLNKFQTKAPIDLNDWKAILDASKLRLDHLRNMPKSTKRDKSIQRLAEQLYSFGLIKDAFRNHIAHAREQYDERRAKNLMSHVESFSHSLVK